ncbi:hypothetical protein F1188_07510 [Roseospira marina]|uniref:Sarcosine oxidase subunit gamma n=1 Tax=Roseospira marina TaxID=140057 RepID=A0A5M6IE66_9PROT|nr:hypothetical protein [Roseospira marina]KAA5606257.1 hypothetical protein F1188_07510 [Roseospira marina]MBB4314413.1 heterotetrameric sarcosine oxidase gamma subunit [Roseospira marina]MBB5087573.1 heterotetrameric sarcosine oxidase gamma subunit [Roseospira marina]
MPKPAANPAPLFDRPAPVSPLAGCAQPAHLPDALLTERHGLTLWHVDAGRASAPETLAGLNLPRTPNTVDAPKGPKGPAALWLGPGRWLLALSASGPTPDDAPELTLVDQTHARCALRLVGAGARTELAKGCALDLSEATFEEDQCAQTLLHDIPVLLHAADDDVIDLYVARSFARALWETLAHLPSGKGVRAAPTARTG